MATDFSFYCQSTRRRKDSIELLAEQKNHLMGLLRHGMNMNRSVQVAIMDCIKRHPELAGRREKYLVDENLGDTSLLLLLCAWNASLPLVATVVLACPRSIKSYDFSSKLVYSLPLHMACCSQASVELIQCLYHYHPEASTKVDFHTQLPLCYALMYHTDYALLLPILATRPSLESFVDLKWSDSATNSLPVVVQTLATLFQCTHISLTLRHTLEKAIFSVDRTQEGGNSALSITLDAATNDLLQLIQTLRSLSIPVTKILLRECSARLLEKSLLPKIESLTELTQVQLMSTTVSSKTIKLFWTAMLKLPLLNHIFIYDIHWSTPGQVSDFRDLSLLYNLRRLNIMTCRVKSAFLPAVAALLQSPQTSLTSLNITANQLDADAVHMLAESLVVNKSLQRLFATNIHTPSAPIIRVLADSNCTLVECMFQDKSEAEYYTALNKAGRGKLRHSQTTKVDFVNLLAGLEDTRCVYGLLLEHPALWST